MSQGKPPHINLTLRAKTDHPAINRVEIPATFIKDSAWVNITAPLYIGSTPISNFSQLTNVTFTTPVVFPVPNGTPGQTNVYVPPWNGSITVTNNSVVISNNQSSSAPMTIICSQAVLDMFIRARDIAGLVQALATCPALPNTLSGVIPATVQTTTQTVTITARKSRSGRNKIRRGTSVGQIVQGGVQVAQAATETALLGPTVLIDAVQNLFNLINPVDINSLAMSCELNQGEEDVDCGGPCTKCAELQGPALITDGIWVAIFVGLGALVAVLLTYLSIVQRNRKFSGDEESYRRGQ
jgi:hypothetical protein